MFLGSPSGIPRVSSGAVGGRGWEEGGSRLNGAVGMEWGGCNRAGSGPMSSSPLRHSPSYTLSLLQGAESCSFFRFPSKVSMIAFLNKLPPHHQQQQETDLTWM